MKNVGIGVLITILISVFLLLFYTIYEECTYESKAQFAKYIIEVELLSGTKKIITVREPVNTHMQINCHSHKGTFNGCALEGVFTDLTLGGHWYKIKDGVVDFRIISKEVEK